MKDWEEAFARYDAEHPELYRMFKRFVFELLQAGRKRISHGTVIERLRWESMIGATRGEDEFKVNQNFGRPMALRFARQFNAPDLFEFRQFKGRDAK